MVRNGEFKQLLKYKPPFVLGHDVAGVVTEVGADVRGFAVGDEVFARPRDLRIGTFAEYIAIDEDDVALKPATLSLHEAAAVPLVALAAWQILVEKAHIQPGQKVLVHAGAGGLGSTVIQLAKHLGAHVATTATAPEQQLVRDLGADVVIDYTTQDFAEILSGYDLVVDSLGGENLLKSLTVLKPGGLAIGVTGPPDAGFANNSAHPNRSSSCCRSSAARSAKPPRNAACATSSSSCTPVALSCASSPRSTTRVHCARSSTPPSVSTGPSKRSRSLESGKAKAGKVIVTLD